MNFTQLKKIKFIEVVLIELHKTILCNTEKQRERERRENRTSHSIEILATIIQE